MDLAFRCASCSVDFSANCRLVTENNDEGIDRSHTALSTTTIRIPSSRLVIFGREQDRVEKESAGHCRLRRPLG